MTRDELLTAISSWAENHPYVCYGDRNDEFTTEQVELLLTDRQKFDEYWWENVEINAFEYADWDSLQKDMLDEFRAAIWEHESQRYIEYDSADELTFEDLPEDMQEAFDDYKLIDTTDILETCFRHSRPNIAVTLLRDEPDSDNELEIRLPHHGNDEKYNDELRAYFVDKFGCDPDLAETCYYYDCVKLCGRLDLKDVYENGLPTMVTISIGEGDNLVTHNSCNGSGGLGSIPTTKAVTCKARFECDDADRYGIDSVFGFTGEFWRRCDITVAAYTPWQ